MPPKKADTVVEANDKIMRSKYGQACRYMKTGELDKAESNFKEILNSAIEEYGEIHQRVGSALHNIGITRLRRGNLDGALHSIDEAVKIRRAAHGEFHHKVAVSNEHFHKILIKFLNS